MASHNSLIIVLHVYIGFGYFCFYVAVAEAIVLHYS